jgi:hypothetical protein
MKALPKVAARNFFDPARAKKALPGQNPMARLSRSPASGNSKKEKS